MKTCLQHNAAGVLLALAAFSFGADAHEFWLDASPFRPAPGAQTMLTLNVGEYFIGERVGVTTAHAASLRVLSAGKDADLGRLVPTGPSMLPSLPLTFDRAGSHVLAYESQPSTVVLAADKFHAYLHDEGLDAIVRQREAAGTAATPGRERFRRSAKALLAVGGKADGASTRIAGQRLEITPMTDPLNAAAADTVRFLLRFEGRPRPGVLIKAWHRSAQQTTVLRATTDVNGMVALTLPFAGVWMLNAVHMVATTESPDIDWDSFWSSLTFELRARR